MGRFPAARARVSAWPAALALQRGALAALALVSGLGLASELILAKDRPDTLVQQEAPALERQSEQLGRYLEQRIVVASQQPEASEPATDDKNASGGEPAAVDPEAAPMEVDGSEAASPQPAAPTLALSVPAPVIPATAPEAATLPAVQSASATRLLDTHPAPQASFSETGSLHDQMLDSHNRERSRHGLAGLRYDPGLAAVAERRAAENAGAGSLSHTLPGGGTVFDLLASQGIGYYYAGENLALNLDGRQPVEDAMRAFLGSAIHRANVLGGEFSRIGVGVAKVGRATYFAVVFAGP